MTYRKAPQKAAAKRQWARFVSRNQPIITVSGIPAAVFSSIDHFDDFAKGVIDTTHLIYYLSFITFGLFLTAKSVDSERWRG